MVLKLVMTRRVKLMMSNRTSSTKLAEVLRTVFQVSKIRRPAVSHMLTVLISESLRLT